MRRVIIAGGRDFDDYVLLYEKCVDVLGPLWRAGIDTTIVSGAAKGADKLGELFAREMDLVLISEPANWEEHGKAAGPIRNLAMAQIADTLIAFWDGESRGTKNMIETALKKGLEIHVFRYG
jgi:hypothetical protein